MEKSFVEIEAEKIKAALNNPSYTVTVKKESTKIIRKNKDFTEVEFTFPVEVTLREQFPNKV